MKFDFEFNNEIKAQLRKIYLKKLKEISKGFIETSEIKISIEFNKGSLRTKIKIWGLVTTLYVGVGQYGSFKQGIKEIISDVKKITEHIIQSTQNEPSINKSKIIRYERRTGILGRIEYVYRRIDNLEKKSNSLSQDEMRIELNSIKQLVVNISAVLPLNVSQYFLKELPDKFKKELPEPNEKKVKYLMNRYILKPKNEYDFIID